MPFHALVSAFAMPEFDREGGSKRVLNMLQMLRSLGWNVTYIPAQGATETRYTQLLQQLGIATYTDSQNYQHPERLIEMVQFDVAIFHFWNIAEHWIPFFRKYSPKTKLIIDTVDLHFLREARETFYKGIPENRTHFLGEDYGSKMIRELNSYSIADAVIAVSEKEAKFLSELLTDKVLVHPIPDYEELEHSPYSFEQRNGVVFLGNFRHPPNVDAVQYLCHEIVPNIDESCLEQHPMYIVGNGLSEAVVEHARDIPNINLIGWVPSFVPYLTQARATIVPLRYGAGTKRKVIQSLLIGTPVITTKIGAEGLDLIDGETALITDDPFDFANAVERVLCDPILWATIATQGRDHIASTHSKQNSRAHLENLLNLLVISSKR